MFRKLLNVGKGHSSNDKLLQQQQQQKSLFQLNEIKSYGFSHLCCLGYSTTLSLLAVGSKHGLLKVLGNSSVEFSYQLESGNSIRQIEFIDCRSEPTTGGKSSVNKQAAQANGKTKEKQQPQNTSAQIVVLTDNGQLHLFELKTFKQQNFADNTTQTEGAPASDCCQESNPQQTSEQSSQSNLAEFTKLERSAQLDYFKYKLDDEDRSKRITTLEISSNGLTVYVGTEGGNLYQVPLDKFLPFDSQQQEQVQEDEELHNNKIETIQEEPAKTTGDSASLTNNEVPVTISDETETEDAAAVRVEVEEPFEMIKFDEDVFGKLGDDVKSKKQGAIESIKRHPASLTNANANSNKILISYHRGLSVIYDVQTKSVEKYFYHNQVLESSCFADQSGNFFYTSHNDGSYIKWNARQGNQAKANEDFIGQLYGPYPCKPTPKIQACTGLVNDQLEELVIFSGGMPRATYDDKNPVTIVKAEADGKDTIKTVLDFTSKVLDFVVITRPRGNLGAGAKSTGSGGGGGGGGKKNRHKQQQQQQQQRNHPIAVALAILAEEEFVVIDLLNSESYLEFPLPYLNCVHSTAITCNQHYSEISDELYEKLLANNKQQLKGKLSTNDWPITGGQVIDAPEVRSHDILLTGHEDGSVHFWDVSDLSMRHLLHLPTSRFFSTSEDDLVPIDGPAAADKKETADLEGSNNNNNQAASNNDNSETQDSSSAWPPLKRVGRFDPYSDDTRLAIRKLSLCPQTGTLVVAGTGGKYRE